VLTNTNTQLQRIKMSFKSKQMVRLRFSGRKLADLDFWTKSDPYLVISRPKSTGNFQMIRRTETVWNNLNPDWKLLYISTAELCGDDFNMNLKIEVFDEDRNSRDDFIGSVDISLSYLLKISTQSEPKLLLKKGSVTRGMLVVQECRFEDMVDSESERKFSTSSYPNSANSLSYGHVAATSVHNNEPNSAYHFTEGSSYHQPHLMDSTYLNQPSSYAGFVCPSPSTSSQSQHPNFSQPTQSGGFLPLSPCTDVGPPYSHDNRPSYFF